MSTPVAFVLALAAASAVTFPAPSPAHADPLYCVVIYDQNGHPVDTICVPAPW